MFARLFVRRSACPLGQFIRDTQTALVFSTIDFLILATFPTVGITLPNWLVYSMYFAIAVSVVCGLVGLVLEIVLDVRSSRRANKHIAAYHAQQDSSKMYNCCQHDAK